MMPDMCYTHHPIPSWLEMATSQLGNIASNFTNGLVAISEVNKILAL